MAVNIQTSSTHHYLQFDISTISLTTHLYGTLTQKFISGEIYVFFTLNYNDGGILKT